MTESLTARDTRHIFESCPLPALVLDRAGTVLDYNRAFIDLVGQQQLAGLSGRQPAALLDHPLKELLTGKTRLKWLDHKGQQRYLFVQQIELPDSNEKKVWFFIDRSEHTRLQTSNNSLKEQLQENLLTDPVTGLLNQRGLILALEPQIARCRRYNSTLSIIIMSVDAPVQRQQLIIEIAHLLKDQLRWADLVGCSEDHDFILALPETPEQAALQLTRKLKPLLDSVSEQHFSDTSISSCYGIAGWRKSDNAASLLQRAGTALAQARNDNLAESIAL